MAATETVGPFDGTPWAQDQWYRYAAAWAPSGVLDVPAASASAGSLGLTFNGLTPTLAAGRAWVRGAGYELAGGSKTLSAVPANTNLSLSRRDRIVLRRDLAAKTVTPLLVQGTPAATPAAPALTQSETGQWDMPLFSFTTPPNSGTAITAITDERAWVVTASPPPLVPIPVASGWTAVSGRAPAVCLDSSGFVTVMGAVTNNNTYTPNSGGPYIMAVLPVGYRPALSTSVSVYFGGNAYAMTCSANPDGTIIAGNYPASIGNGTVHAFDGIRFHPGYAGTAP